jgi:DNA polymerase-4
VAVGYAAARGVVAAASYEARKFGVRSALPSVTAMRRCPELVFVRPRFDVYRAVSRQIHAIFADYTPLIQPLSLDEAYLDVSANLRGIPTAWATAKEIRARILEETGLTASAGISYNKFLAKLASDQRKPNGQFAVTPEMGATWVETLPVALPRRGARDRAEDAGAGDRDRRGFARQVGRVPARAFRQRGELVSRHLARRGRSPRAADQVRKSSGSETTFDRDLVEAPEIEAGVLRMADDVWGWCEKAQAFGRTVTVKVKYGDFQQITRSRSVSGAGRHLRPAARDQPDADPLGAADAQGDPAGRGDGVELRGAAGRGIAVLRRGARLARCWTAPSSSAMR